MVPTPALGPFQIDAAQQQRQFLMAEHDLGLPAHWCRPTNAAFLQSLGTDS